MKLAVFPKCYVNDIVEGGMTLSQWIRMASALPVDGLELYDRFLAGSSSSYLYKVRKEISDRGLEMPMLCFSPDFTHPDRTVRAREIARQKKAIACTAELGGRFCRTLSGQRRPGIGETDGISWVIEAILESLDAARQHGITLVMENHYKDGFWEYPEFAQESRVFLRIIEQIDHESFGVQYDPSNAIVAGEDPLALLRAVAPRVKTMHASDRSLAPGASLEDLARSHGAIGYSSALRHGVIGKGLNDYAAIFSILEKAGFDGWVSIEDGMNGMDELAESAAFLRRFIHEN